MYSHDSFPLDFPPSRPHNACMNLFYLNEQKEPVGPFSREELLNLLGQGTVNRNTLAAAAGDDDWKTLAELLNLPELPSTAADGAATPPPLPEGDLGQCPFCRQALRGSATPPNCPHCHKPLHPGTDGLWANFVYAFKRFLSFRGRATRTEYWSFYLFSSLLSYIPCQLIAFGLIAAGILNEEMQPTEGELSSEATLVCLALFALYLLLALCIALPHLGTLVRRLHDRNHSGWLLLWPVVICVGMMIAVAVAVLSLAGEAEAAPKAAAILPLLLGVLAYMGFCIYLFVQLVLPGQAGPNKYGPAKLIPFRR